MAIADQDILEKAITWLDAGKNVYLITVIQTWGSSPRPPGSMMIISRDGYIAGSVSGGCIEEDIIEKVDSIKLQATLPKILQYGGDLEQERRFQLPCGGTMRLVFETLNDNKQLKHILSCIKSGGSITREVNIANGETKVFNKKINKTIVFDNECIYRTFGPKWRLLLIGAGELSQIVTRLALLLDFQVIVCDPREEYFNSWDLQESFLKTGMPDDVINEMNLDDRSAVVTLTHDPKLDDLALLEALNSPAFFIGALGSKTTSLKRKERLRSLGITSLQINRLSAPVGLDINSHKPAEIAISILAEIIATQNSAFPNL